MACKPEWYNIVKKLPCQVRREAGMKNGEMAVKRKAKRPGQQKRKIDSTVSGREQTERQATQQAERQTVQQEERQTVQQEDKQRLRQQGRESVQADYRTEACMESFSCANCGKEIHPDGAGSNHRNHCPYCLYSLHVDEEPGDRKASCHGKMEPIAVVSREDGDWSILHRCMRCGKLNLNRALADDNPILLMQLAVKPLASPPFPLSYLEHFLQENAGSEKR